jgi:hypothetical protein
MGTCLSCPALGSTLDVAEPSARWKNDVSDFESATRDARAKPQVPLEAPHADLPSLGRSLPRSEACFPDLVINK